MSHSVSSIVKSARGDLDTDILEKIESVYGLDFLQSNERIQYIGKSTWGIRITSDTVDDRLGSANYNFVTDRGIRLAIKNEDEFIHDIVIGYDRINEIEYNSGITKDSIIIHTDEVYKLDISKLNITFQSKFSDEQTKEAIIKSPSIKFRLRASAESGTSVDDIASYIKDRIKEDSCRRDRIETQYSKLNKESRRLDSKQIRIPKPDSFESVGRRERKYDRLKSKIEDWRAVEGQYSKLNRKSRRLDSKQIHIPKPDSFESAKSCKNKYNKLEEEIVKWEAVEKVIAETHGIQSKIEERVAGSPAEEMWLKSLPDVESVQKFDTATKAINKYNSIKRNLEDVDPIITQAVALEDYISRHASEMTRTEYKAIQKIHQECIDCFGNHRDLSEVESNLKRLNDILSLSLSLTDTENNPPIDPQELIESIPNNGIPESEELQEWQNLTQKVEKISTFMNDVNLSHSSIDAEHWKESLEMAVEEQYVSVLSPIVDQVEKMESGMWELDDLQQISWQEFETLIGTLYESFGYETEVTSDTADMGVDVWATNADERVAIQAKRYQEGNTVGRETLQKLASTLARGDADRVIVVTTSTFARTAKEYSDSFGSEIKLINGEELRDQLNNSDIPPIN